MEIIEAIKKIYPTIQGGFVYWETKQDGSEWGNPIDGLVWENAEFVKPTWGQIESHLSNVELEEAKAKKRKEINALRDANLEKPTPQVVTYDGNLSNRSFDISAKIHLPIFESIIAGLQRKINSGITNPTRGWTDASGERLDLNIDDYNSLASHLDYRDDIEHAQAKLKNDALKELTTLEEVEAFDINQVIA